jgi:hypothetical protein
MKEFRGCGIAPRNSKPRQYAGISDQPHDLAALFVEEKAIGAQRIGGSVGSERVWSFCSRGKSLARVGEQMTTLCCSTRGLVVILTTLPRILTCYFER